MPYKQGRQQGKTRYSGGGIGVKNIGGQVTRFSFSHALMSRQTVELDRSKIAFGYALASVAA
jgi:hypothetical protein